MVRKRLRLILKTTSFSKPASSLEHLDSRLNLLSSCFFYFKEKGPVMKTNLVIFVMAIAASADAGVMPSISKIGQVESSNRPWVRRKAGELGECQIMPGTWADHAKPGERWWIRKDNRRVAQRYIAWIKKQLIKKGRKPTPAAIMACYNCGLSNYLKGRVPKQTIKYLRKYNLRLNQD